MLATIRSWTGQQPRIEVPPDENSQVQYQRRRVVVIAIGTTVLDAELISHTFAEAGSVPDANGNYSVEFLRLDESQSPETMAGLTGLESSLDGAFHTDLDTFVITGPYGPPPGDLRPVFREWLKQQCLASRRIVSIAGGTAFLASTGLLKGRSVVAHWDLRRHLEGSYSGITVRSDILYTWEGNIYTCAGALATIDLALRLVEDDLGGAAAMHVARRMLVPLRRSPACNQISFTLQAQGEAGTPIADLLAWLPAQLGTDLSIAKLARRVAMSPRNFTRRFAEQIGVSPGRYIEELRFEAAKRELSRQGQSISGAAQVSGFGNTESLRRLFQRRLGITPKLFRERAILGIDNSQTYQ
jgi:transcriptional regulator GlxA family with amidase domain